MVVLLVESLPRSVAFYRRLGVAFPEGMEARRDVVVPLGDDHDLVISETFGKNEPGRVAPSGSSRTMLEFFVAAPAEVDRLWTELTSAGHRGVHEPFTTDFGAYMCLVDDPDGTTVLVTAG
jgi:predicted lactoylglutathione lyase